MKFLHTPDERIAEATAWLQQAPDLNQLSYTPEEAMVLARHMLVAWGVLTDGSYPYSARAPEERAVNLVCPDRGTIWKHFKGGLYIVRGPAFDATANKAAVRYRAFDLKTVGSKGVEYTRTLEDWYAEVPDHGPRFEAVSATTRAHSL